MLRKDLNYLADIIIVIEDRNGESEVIAKSADRQCRVRTGDGDRGFTGFTGAADLLPGCFGFAAAEGDNRRACVFGRYAGVITLGQLFAETLDEPLRMRLDVVDSQASDVAKRFVLCRVGDDGRSTAFELGNPVGHMIDKLGHLWLRLFRPRSVIEFNMARKFCRLHSLA